MWSPPLFSSPCADCRHPVMVPHDLRQLRRGECMRPAGTGGFSSRGQSARPAVAVCESRSGRPASSRLPFPACETRWPVSPSPGSPLARPLLQPERATSGSAASEGQGCASHGRDAGCLTMRNAFRPAQKKPAIHCGMTSTADPRSFRCLRRFFNQSPVGEPFGPTMAGFSRAEESGPARTQPARWLTQSRRS